MSPAIDQHSAWIRVDGAKQRAERVEQSDDEHARAQRLHVFWEEPDPELFSGADDESGEEENDEVALESEKFRRASPKIHDGRVDGSMAGERRR